ncbi:MAG TPA: alpha/beta hydrolase [Mucilaginibacter sp.]|jgi:acetyl esterase/lipase|nr:alpha/beta hydrolase [Mucilaginibacter sp.]
MPRSNTSFLIKFIAAALVILCFSNYSASAFQPKTDSTQTKYFSEIKKFSEPFVNDLRRRYVQTYSLPEADFIRKIDSAHSLLTAVLNKYSASLKAGFVKEQQLQVDYYFDKLLADYPSNYIGYTGKALPDAALITARLRRHLPDLNDPALLNEVMLRTYVHSFFTYELTDELDKPTYRNLDNQSLVAVFNLISRQITNKKCRDFWQYDYLYDGITNNGIKNIGVIYQAFNKTCSDTAYLHRVNGLYKYEYKRRQGHLIKTYKIAGAYKLDIHLFLPDSAAKGGKKPLMVFFHAGDWKEGKPDWYFDDCKAWTRKGWVACAVEYRTFSREGTLPFEAVVDARSAIRWLRQHAQEYNIDTGRIVANGYDAGGQLALACAMAGKYNEKTDDQHFSPAPNLIMVTSGIFDVTDTNNAWIKRYLKDKNALRDISPIYLVRKGLPPMLIIHGRKDAESDYAIARHFATLVKDAGNPVSFHPVDDATHLLWLDSKSSGEMEKVQGDFLRKWGYDR